MTHRCFANIIAGHFLNQREDLLCHNFRLLITSRMVQKTASYDFPNLSYRNNRIQVAIT